MTDPNRPSIMIELKEQTAELHSYAEHRPLQRDMLKGSIKRERYTAYLGQLMWVHHTLEHALEEQNTRHPAFGVVLRPYQQRLGDLRADLEFFGQSPDKVEPLPATMRVVEAIAHTARQTPVALLGMLYVLEGSNNGSKYIARSMMRGHDLQPGKGVSYLDPYGDSQMDRWQQFKKDMDAAGFSEEEGEQLVAAAKIMFQGIADISDDVYEPVAA